MAETNALTDDQGPLVEIKGIIYSNSIRHPNFSITYQPHGPVMLALCIFQGDNKGDKNVFSALVSASGGLW